MLRTIFTTVAASLITAAALWMIAKLEEISLFRPIAEGAVVAFDRDNLKLDECPNGWEPFEPSHGRFIVGSDSELGFRAEGGSKTHTLSPDEMPRHEHAIRNFEWGYDVDGDPNAPMRIDVHDDHPWAGQRGELITTSAGKGVPHNNMPPYIALYYCKKK